MTIKVAVGKLASLIREAGRRLHASDDSFARDHGWTIETRHGGLGRAYRDPRFDRLMRCPRCEGEGADALDRPCPRCSGSGRIIVRQSSIPTRR